MSWQDVEVDLGRARKGRVHWSVTLKQGGARITVPNVIVEALGWTQHTALKLQLGAGDRSGSLRILADSKGPIRATKPYANAKSLQYRLGTWSGMPERDQEQIAIRHEVLDGGLVLHLPPATQHAVEPVAGKAAVPDAVATLASLPKPRAAASIMSGPPPERPTAAKRDVTAQFFDDPKRPVQMASGVRGGRS